jgi:hypothetical protein
MSIRALCLVRLTSRALLGRGFALCLFLLLGATLARAQGGIVLVQHTSKDAGTTSSSSLAFVSANTAGNWIAVVIRAGKAGQVFTVTDARLNTYHKAIQFNETTDGTTLGIFYAENIAGGANTITVSDTISGTLRFTILEYSGVALTNSLDTTATAQGTSASPNTGNLTTTAPGDLLLGEISTANSASFTAGAGYVVEELVPTAGTKLIAEDQIQATTTGERPWRRSSPPQAQPQHRLSRQPLERHRVRRSAQRFRCNCKRR